VHPTTPPPGWLPPPDWYPDPSGAPGWRWWDGSQWTPATSPWIDPDDPVRLVDGERTWAKVLRIFVLVDLALTVIGGIVLVSLAVWFARKGGWDWLEDELDDGDGGWSFNVSLPFGGGLSSIFGAVWGYQATKAARALGLPTVRGPGWAAAGHLVPIVNFWFPYQVQRDVFPEDARPRGRIITWWALSVCAWIPGLVGVVFAFTGDPWPAGVLLGTCFAGLAVAHLLRWRLVGEAQAAHERLLEARRTAAR
jgi:hypothetical protein